MFTLVHGAGWLCTLGSVLFLAVLAQEQSLPSRLEARAHIPASVPERYKQEQECSFLCREGTVPDGTACTLLEQSLPSPIVANVGLARMAGVPWGHDRPWAHGMC